MKTLHLIGNAHIDPVWLWDWREGLQEGLITCRTLLDLMDRNPELAVIRGEAALYRHIEDEDPTTFRRIRRRVAEGRWDVVGGTGVQMDTNLPATETMIRQYREGLAYFNRTFDQPIRAGWAADSFGHSAGLPDILAMVGLRYYAFTRPEAEVLPIAQPVFHWIGPAGGRVLAYRPPLAAYLTERDEIPRRLDQYREWARTARLDNIATFWGLGNHGGGPTQGQIDAIRAWAEAHPDIRVKISTLHGFFDALGREVRRWPRGALPEFRGELNFVLRGCYTSAAVFKRLFRKAEAQISRAETTATVIAAAQGRPPPRLEGCWSDLLFNSFHDILPGSSIERAYEDQTEWLGGAIHQARKAEFDALRALARTVDASILHPAEGDNPQPVTALVWNPHPQPYTGPIELENCLDYRPLMAYTRRAHELPITLWGPDGRPRPFQVIPRESPAFSTLAWRYRILTPVTISPWGWQILQFGYREQPPVVEGGPNPAECPAPGVITNGLYAVSAKVGEADVHITLDGEPVFQGGGLTAQTVADPWGSWGAMGSETEGRLQDQHLQEWSVVRVQTLENGPERATLWVRMAGGRSQLDLFFRLCRGRRAIDLDIRVTWNEDRARLKMVFPLGAEWAEFEVPGGVIRRGECGEVPGGRWVRTHSSRGRFGLATDALYGFDLTRGALRATICRATRHADDEPAGTGEREPWRPVVDRGEWTFRALITPGDEQLPRRAAELEKPPVVLWIPARPGILPREGSLAELAPATVRLLALTPGARKGEILLRAQADAEHRGEVKVRWLGRRRKLGRLAPGALGEWVLPGRIRDRA